MACACMVTAHVTHGLNALWPVQMCTTGTGVDAGRAPFQGAPRFFDYLGIQAELGGAMNGGAMHERFSATPAAPTPKGAQAALFCKE